MTENKDLKRIVRARMKKTGESYTSARAQITTKSQPKKTVADALPARPAPSPKEYGAIAGISDAVIKQKTGCNWERWVKSLDYHGAAEMSHREIAKIVKETYKVPSWWTQTVTVGYERIKGLRARGQQRDGSYQTTKSKTFNVPVETLFDAWKNAAKRRRWLDGAAVKVRTATAPKSMRLDWNGESIISVLFASKGDSKSSVSIEHTKLPDREAVDQLKHYWSERLAVLGDQLKD